MTEERPTDRPPRFVALDGLRGVAAVVVMLYHYSMRYRQLYDAGWHPGFEYDGRFGVLLFFMISGYVITLTTRRLRRPFDFVFFRVSRLYPTFWVCLAITTAVMLLAGGPPPRPTVTAFAMNATMVSKSISRFGHGLRPTSPYIDGAYWSLEIELFFYVLTFLLVVTRQARHTVAVLIGLVLVSAVDHWLLLYGRPIVPSVVRWLLFFDYLPYFGIGVALFAMRQDRRYRLPGLLLGLCLLRAFEGVVEQALHVEMPRPPPRPGEVVELATPWIELIKTLVCAGLFAATVYDRVPPLRWRVVVALGAVSYPLYLLHQNVGYTVQHHLHDGGGVPALAAVGAAVVVAMLAATAVSLGIERPSLHWLRRAYLRVTHRVAPAAPVSGLAPAVPVTAEDRTV